MVHIGHPGLWDRSTGMNVIPDASAIGLIMYAAICTSPDISCALSILRWHRSNPGEAHLYAAKIILKFLRGTKEKFLVFGGQDELQ